MKHYRFCKMTQFTFLPTAFLCRLNFVRASFPFSSLSVKRLARLPLSKLDVITAPLQSRSVCSCFVVLPHLHAGIMFYVHALKRDFVCDGG